MKLNEACILKSGFQGKTTEGNDYRLLKLKDVNSDGVISYEGLEEFSSEKLNEKYLLIKDDILFKAKSGDNTAALIDSDLDNVIASAQYIIITIKNKEELDPGYLTMYLNSEYAQDYFKKHSEGSALSIVKIKSLEDLEIKLIPIEKQKELAKIYKLMKEEKVHMEKLAQTREKQFKAYLREVLD